jgi:hypothetical protein
MQSILKDGLAKGGLFHLNGLCPKAESGPIAAEAAAIPVRACHTNGPQPNSLPLPARRLANTALAARAETISAPVAHARNHAAPLVVKFAEPGSLQFAEKPDHQLSPFAVHERRRIDRTAHPFIFAHRLD